MNGRLVNIGRMGGRLGELDMERLSFLGLRIIGVSFRARSREQTLGCIEACARDLLPHLASGAIKVPIERTYPLSDIAAAHDFVEQDAHVGKIVLTLTIKPSQKEESSMTYQTIEVRKLNPVIGAEIFGVDLSRDLGNQQFQEVHDALMENLVIFFRDQNMTDRSAQGVRPALRQPARSPECAAGDQGSSRNPGDQGR